MSTPTYIFFVFYYKICKKLYYTSCFSSLFIISDITDHFQTYPKSLSLLILPLYIPTSKLTVPPYIENPPFSLTKPLLL